MPFALSIADLHLAMSLHNSWHFALCISAEPRLYLQPRGLPTASGRQTLAPYN